ncbi:TonB-dependent receptor [Pseudoalteromonas ruthenica]|uniref:TonB-dependent receptor n=1 Tax=Pseudoalteromonas ruthenica TaxID=151081 RepID=UPI000348AA3A|nr:TonB-dependent receptor [Pseudoalteromonas ruthenica]
MHKKTQLASAIMLALSCNLSVAAEVDANEQRAQSKNKEENVEVIVVSGIRGSLNKALNVKRQSYQVVDAIVAEDIGKFPDNNVVEALQRVTGVQVTDRGAGEVSTVSIRGLTDVTTTVNGRQIFTAAGRNVALADIPAALLESVDVFKTRSASQVGSGIAGQINIHTQRPFNFEDSKVVVAARGIYQEQADKVDPNLSLLLSDRWESDFGEFGALVNVSYAETHFRDQNIAAGAMVPFMTMNPADGFGALERIQTTDGRVSEELIWQPGLENGLPFQSGSTLGINGIPTEYYLSRDAVFGNDFSGKRERPAANISLQWRPNDDSQYTFEAFYNGYRNEAFNSLLFTFTDWWGNVDASNPPVLFEGTNIIKERYVDAPYNFTSGDLTVGETDSFVYALGGEWNITDDFKLESEVYYQDSEYTEEFFAMRTDRVAYGVNVDFNDDDGIPALSYVDNPETDVDETNLTDPSQWNVAQLYDNGSRSQGDALTFTLDGELYVDNFGFDKLRFGVRYDKRTASDAMREVDGNLGRPLSELDSGLVSTNSNFFDGNANYPSSWAVADGFYIYDNRDYFRDLYGFSAPHLQLETTFDIEETTYSAYIQGDFSTMLFGREFDGQIGLRYEDAKADMTFFDIDQNPTAVSGAENTSDAWLPSLVVRYHLADDVIARAAYTQTIRRPDFAQLNSFIYYTEDVTDIGYGTASGGNPDLEPVESKNYDLTLEWYFADDSSLYGTWFKRDIEGFVFDSRRIVQYQGPEDDAPYPYILSQPDNSSNGTLDGWELGLVYFPEALPDMLKGLGVQASATLLDSSQDLPTYSESGAFTGYDTRDIFGVSKESYSAVLIYERDNFDMRLGYVWRDDFLSNYEAAQFANPLGIYRRPEQSLDFQLSYDVTDELTVTFDGTNLTEEIYQTYYQYPNTHNSANSLFSRTFALGVRYSL